jgi:hypothetical protein
MTMKDFEELFVCLMQNCLFFEQDFLFDTYDIIEVLKIVCFLFFCFVCLRINCGDVLEMVRSAGQLICLPKFLLWCRLFIFPWSARRAEYSLRRRQIIMAENFIEILFLTT